MSITIRVKTEWYYLIIWVHIVIVSLIFRLLKIIAYLLRDNIGTDNGGSEESRKHGLEESTKQFRS